VTPAPGELEVGRIGSPHGVRGEVTVTFVTNRTERAAPGAELRGADRTLVVASARPHHDKWLIRFEGVDDRNAAEALRGTLLTAAPLARGDVLAEGEYWVHELIGSRVVDCAGEELGTVVAVEANPAHDLLVLDTGSLVPIAFLVRHDDGDVVVDLPDGLLDL
jgi:16S rRNA processing protein RimM